MLFMPLLGYVSPGFNRRILGHFDQHWITYLVWQDGQGCVHSQPITTLATNKAFIRQLSKEDIFLFGYLLGSAYEKSLNIAT